MQLMYIHLLNMLTSSQYNQMQNFGAGDIKDLYRYMQIMKEFK